MSRSTSPCCGRKQLVSNRKAGNQVFYSVRDPILIEVLNLMRTYFHAHLKESLTMLDEMEKPHGDWSDEFCAAVASSLH